MGTSSKVRKRQRVHSDSGSNGSAASKASAIVSSTVKVGKKVARKVVAFLSPKKNTSTGTKSDTPHRSSTTNNRVTRSRSSSNASLPSLASVSSCQSVFLYLYLEHLC
jgi:hypothetical protein